MSSRTGHPVGLRVRARRRVVLALMLLGPLWTEMLFGRASVANLVAFGVATVALLLEPFDGISRRTHRLMALCIVGGMLAEALLTPSSGGTIIALFCLLIMLPPFVSIMRQSVIEAGDRLQAHDLQRWRQIIPPVEPAPLGSRAAEVCERLANWMCEQGVPLSRAHEMLDQVDCAHRDVKAMRLTGRLAGQPRADHLLHYVEGAREIHMLCVDVETLRVSDDGEDAVIVGYARMRGRWKNDDGGGRGKRTPRQAGRRAGQPALEGA